MRINIRAAYSIKDLTNIFNAEGYTKDNFSRSYMFWTPIIALFQGMRQNEIAQLHLDDIKKAGDGTWVFDVNNLGDKRTKTTPSQRLVPIHPFLLNDLGILKLKRKLLNEGYDRLFPGNRAFNRK
jgi:integrase